MAVRSGMLVRVIRVIEIEDEKIRVQSMEACSRT